MKRYCITHGAGNFSLGDDEVPDANCLIVYSPAPFLDMSDAWADSLVDPSEDELIQMDMNAEVLEQDFLMDVEPIQADEPLKKFLNLMDRYYHEQN